MNYQKIFTKSIQSTFQAVAPLREETFIDACENVLRNNEISILLDRETDLSQITDGPGLYCFWIDLTEWHKNDKYSLEDLLELFADEWLMPAEQLEHSPRENKGNIAKLLKDNREREWVPLYIGKAQNVRSRVIQHIELEPRKTTSALKLKARMEQLQGAKIDVAYLPLQCEPDSYFLVGLVEYLIRKRMLPIVGKQ